MIILVGTEKGGSGKTTIATNLAVVLAERGRDVVLLDTDQQATSAFWHATRAQQHPDRSKLACLEKHGDVFETVKDLEGRYQDVVIDAGGRDSEELRSGMLAADILLSPFRASQFDLWTVERMASLVTKARTWNRDLRALATLNLAPTHARATEPQDAAEMLQEVQAFQLTTAVIHDRKAFRDAAAEGLGVVEWTNPKARSEVTALAEEVFDAP